MQKFLLRRSITLFVTLFLVSVIVFLMARSSGDPRALLLNDYASPEQYDDLGKHLGLDKSYVEQYWIFISNAFQGDLGDSIVDRRSVLSMLKERIPKTLHLTVTAFFLSVLIGVPMGVLSAVRRGGLLDGIGKIIALTGQSIPGFWMGIMLIFLFAVRLDLVPPSGRNGLFGTGLILPSVTLAWFFVAAIMRLVRSAMLDVLDSEYIKLARAKGVSPFWVIWKHGLRNAIIPPLTFAGIILGIMITGTLIVETVFAWPGVGQLAVESMLNYDYPVLQGVVIFYTLVYMLSALLVDTLYAYVDPRIRYT